MCRTDSIAGPGVTVMIAWPDIPSNVAVIVTAPIEDVLTRPAALIAATDSLDELHVAVDETSRVAPSEYVPVATSWSVFPSCCLGLAGVIPIVSNATLLLRESLPPQAASRSSISGSITLRTVTRNSLTH